MKEIIERKLKELNESYDLWLEESDNQEREYIEDKLYIIRSKMNVLKEVLEIYESENNTK